MKESIFRNRLGKFILISNLAFGVIILVLYFLKGFDDAEFGELLKILAPIKSVYLTALIRYVIANRNVENKKPTEDAPKITTLFARTSFLIISIHILSLIAVTTLYALFNAMEFDAMMNIIIGLETFFGIYVGMFMASMFQVEK